ncbi:MAG: hypothetical protein GY832_23090 [Chloroflexi bacterium]|nr:hypothetical protein [Chloroflexota bacterium]
MYGLAGRGLPSQEKRRPQEEVKYVLADWGSNHRCASTTPLAAKGKPTPCVIRKKGADAVLEGTHILQQANLGHPGATRMTRPLRDSFWCPSLSNQVEGLAAQCQNRQSSEESPPPGDMSGVPVPKLNACWTELGMNIVGPFTDAPQHQRYMVTIVDYVSKYLECLLTSDVSAGKLISWLGDLFSHCGNPDQLVTDNSPQFSSPAQSATGRGRDR